MEQILDTSAGRFSVSDDPALLDAQAVHAYLTRSYWSPGIPLATVQTGMSNSHCIGIYDENRRQVGFARLITDRATFANLVDVYVLEDVRGLGLSKALMRFILDIPYVSGLRRFTLNTADAHELYRQFGFTETAAPQSAMEILRPNIYQR